MVRALGLEMASACAALITTMASTSVRVAVSSFLGHGLRRTVLLERRPSHRRRRVIVGLGVAPATAWLEFVGA